VLHGHTDIVTYASFSPDGGRVVTVSQDKTARIWEAATGKQLQELNGVGADVDFAAFSPDGKRIVTLSIHNEAARLWDAATGKQIEQLTEPGFVHHTFSSWHPLFRLSAAHAELGPELEARGLHYAETLRHWRRRFAANRDTIAALYDERFCRMFEFYLAGAELSFRRENMMVFQIQLAHDQAAVPLTRHYIIETERRMAETARAARVPAHALRRSPSS